MPENCDEKTLSYVVARHPVYIYMIYTIYVTYICNNDICYILMYFYDIF